MFLALLAEMGFDKEKAERVGEKTLMTELIIEREERLKKRRVK